MDLHKEKQVVEAAQRDRVHFGILFDTYYGAILNYALRRTGDAAVAQDITAETFYKAMMNIQKFTWQGVSVGNWFYRIATNEIRLYYRRDKYHPMSLDVLFENGFEIADTYDFTQELVEAQDAVERQLQFVQAHKVLSTLPLKYQEVITLRFTEGKKLAEIAVILNKKEGTVKSLLSRGLGKLKLQLQKSRMQPTAHLDIIGSEGPATILPVQELYED